MDSEKLILAVRRYEHLYDMGHSKYMDMEKRDAAWREIAKELKQPPVYCKQKWQSLRDSYRRALRKRESKKGPAPTTFKKWRFEKEISFIASFLAERKPSALADLSNGEESNDSTPIKDEIFLEDSSTIDEQSSNMYTAEQQQSDNHSWEATIYDTSRPTETLKDEVKTEESSISASAAALIMSRLLDERNKHTARTNDDMDNFFLNISSTVKKFPPYLQAITKNKVFKLVSDIEIQQLLPPPFLSSQTTTNSTESWTGDKTPDL